MLFGVTLRKKNLQISKRAAREREIPANESNTGAIPRLNIWMDGWMDGRMYGYMDGTIDAIPVTCARARASTDSTRDHLRVGARVAA